jgi:hypothetical protein
MTNRSGQCMCGAVRFEAVDVGSEFGICHCIMCQQWASGPFPAINVATVSFESEDNLTRFQSSAWAERGFCKLCGSNIFYRVVSDGSYDMSLGAFDDKLGFELRHEIFIDQKPDCYSFAGNHKRLTDAETMALYPEFTAP